MSENKEYYIYKITRDEYTTYNHRLEGLKEMIEEMDEIILEDP
jgi:transposase